MARLDPNAFVNITNDAWFGRTAEPHQHLALAVFRAVEHRLEMVRAVNTGVSAHIDAAGRVLAETESVDPAQEPHARAARRCWWTWPCSRAAAPTARSATLFGFACAGRAWRFWPFARAFRGGARRTGN